MTDHIGASGASRYVPDGGIGTGGFSNVIFCTDMHLSRKVAIKVIKSKEELKRIEDEINALLKLRSKHVVQVYDILDLPKGGVGIVLEYIDGEDLLESPVPNTSEREYLLALWQIATGISDIHGENIIHRDIKPNNMKRDSEGIIKIFDFGLSRDSDSGETTGFKGTYGFAAPELFQEEPSFTQAVDVYAFGATAIYLALGTLPPELLIKTGPEKLVTDAYGAGVISGYPDLAALLTQCMSSDPLERPTVKSIRSELSKYLLKDEHLGVLVSNNKPYMVNKKHQRVRVKNELGKYTIAYNGFDFFFESVEDEVFVNRIPAAVGQRLNGSCVIAIGNHDRGSSRNFASFDISNPEVTF